MLGAGHQPWVPRTDDIPGVHRRDPKGKQRERRDGRGGSEGIILQLDYVGTGAYDASYTLPIRIGSQGQNLSVQIDTGSSDFWLAAKSCEDTICAYPGTDKLYDPSSSSEAVDTGKSFEIQYLSGQVEGEIYWDQVEVGGYTIGSQALAAATSVANEPLGPSFSGVLGLALPGNSIIQSKIPAGFTNAADGAAWPSNLFSITPGPDDPADVAPAQKFLGLTLSRPGSDKIPSILAIGRHPPAGMLTLPDSLGGPSAQIGYGKVNYHVPLPSYNRQGMEIDPLFWKVQITGISVWVDGVEKPVTLLPTPGVALSTGLTAVLDTGVPVIITSKSIADGIYGALGIGPADDGSYYIPCSTPLNLSFSILTTLTSPDPLNDDTTSTASPSSAFSTFTASTSSASTASTSSASTASTSSTASNNSTFTSIPTNPHRKRAPAPITIPYSVHPLDLSDVSSSSKSCTSLIVANDAGLADTGVADMILGVPFLRGVYFVMAYQQPRADGSFPTLATVHDAVPLLGLQTLLDPANSLEEFERVRVLNQPIDNPNAKCENASCTTTASTQKLSTGILVLIVVSGVVGLLLIVGVIFCIRNRRRRREEENDRGVFAPVSTKEGANIEKKSAGLAAFIPAWMRKSEKGGYQPAPIHERNGSAGKDGVSEDELRRIRFARYLARNDDGPVPPAPLFLNSSKDDFLTTMSSGKTRVGESPPRKKDSEEKEHRIDEFIHDRPQTTDLLTGSPTSPPLPTPLQPTHSPKRNASVDARDISTQALTLTETPSPSSSPDSRNFSLPTPSPRGRSQTPVRPPRPNVNLGEFGEISSGMAGIGTATRSRKGLGGGLDFSRNEQPDSPPKPDTPPNNDSDQSHDRARRQMGPRRPTK